MKVTRLVLVSGMIAVMGPVAMAMAQGANEQYLLELINNTREDPAAELNRILAARTANAEINNNLNFWNVNLTVLRNEIQPKIQAFHFRKQPLAWNPLLANAAVSHSQLMQQHQLGTPDHQLPGEPDTTTRIRNTGHLQPNFGFAIGENLPAILTNLLAAHASMLIDWGDNPNGSRTPDGMEPGRPHRFNMLTSQLSPNNPCNPNPGLGSYDEVGIGIVPGSGKMYITQDFGYRCNRDSGHGYVVGVVYRDTNRDGVYSMGEGLGGVTLSFQARNARGTATTNPWGGYQILLESADWVVNLSGPGINSPIPQKGFFITGRANEHLNFVVP
jgi:serralysin